MKLLLSLIIVCSFLNAREINPDSVYLKNGSSSYVNITNTKLEMYHDAGACLADSDVAFWGWLSPSETFYVKEINDPPVIICYEYNVQKRMKRELLRLRGTVQSARSSGDGRFIAVKFLERKSFSEFTASINIYDRKTGHSSLLKPARAFGEFSFDNSGNLIYENGSIREYNPYMGRERSILDIKGIVNKSDLSVAAYISPSGSMLMLLNGGAGIYDGRIYINGKSVRQIDGITSASEAGWISDNEVYLRKGSAGAYYLSVYNIVNGSEKRIGNNSLNTASNFGKKCLAFSFNGTASFYMTIKKAVTVLPLDGEDLAFSQNMDRFGILYGKRLFFAELSSVLKRDSLLKKKLSELLVLYQKALDSKNDWENSYTYDYITGKIESYRKYALGDK